MCNCNFCKFRRGELSKEEYIDKLEREKRDCERVLDSLKSGELQPINKEV